MARLLLVHGSCHGAWCWRDAIPALEALGHAAQAIDLPCHGDDPTPPEEATLDLYARRIAEALEPDTILVGHSMGGFPITAAADLVPGRVRRLVYLCAYVPTDGLSLAQMRRRAPSQPLLEAISVRADRVTFTIDPAKAMDRFCHDADPATAAWAGANYCPEPVLPQETALTVRESLPRSYIVCTLDRTIPPAYQRTMTQGWPPETVFEMASSHSPFLSDPAGLATLLDRIARS